MGTAWQMPIAVIGKPTGDGRQFDQGALSHRDLPLPLRYVATDSGGHNNAVIVGHIAKIGKEADGMLPAKGEFYDDESWPEDVRNAATAAKKFTENKVIGPSVDLDQAEMEHVPEPKAYAAWKKDQVGKLKAAKLAHGGDCGCGGSPAMAEATYDGPRLKMVRSGRVASATLVHIPAFAELSGHAKLTPVDSSNPNVDGTTSSAMRADAQEEPAEDTDKIENDAEMAISEDDTDAAVPHRAKTATRKKPKRDPETVKGSDDTQEMAADDDSLPEDWREKMVALMAGAAPVAPPKQWFADPKLTGPTPLHIGDDGHVYGHVAVWDTCHVGIGDSCVKPPKTLTSYAYFHTGEVKTAEGDRVAVGRLTYGGGHAAPNLGYRAAAEHYDRTSATGAYVRAGEDEHGIWVAGMLAPDADESAVFKMRAAPLSGDWRRVGGNLEMVAALHVNTAGFPIPRAMAASIDGGVIDAAESEQDAFSLVAAGALPRIVDDGDTALTAAGGPLDTDALGRAIAKGIIAEQQAEERRRQVAAEWPGLLAAATAEDPMADYDDVMGGLLDALAQ